MIKVFYWIFMLCIKYNLISFEMKCKENSELLVNIFGFI